MLYQSKASLSKSNFLSSRILIINDIMFKNTIAQEFSFKEIDFSIFYENIRV